MTPENITAISIHIRLTDYKKHLEHYYNMSTASKEYLSNAIDYMDKKYDVSSTKPLPMETSLINLISCYKNRQKFHRLIFYLQNALFYVLSDDIESSKTLLEDKQSVNFRIKYPGNGINHRPGRSKNMKIT